jgi:hypothetical protein
VTRPSFGSGLNRATSGSGCAETRTAFVRGEHAARRDSANRQNPIEPIERTTDQSRAIASMAACERPRTARESQGRLTRGACAAWGQVPEAYRTQGGQRRVAATSRHAQATVTRSGASLAPRRIQALVGRLLSCARVRPGFRASAHSRMHSVWSRPTDGVDSRHDCRPEAPGTPRSRAFAAARSRPSACCCRGITTRQAFAQELRISSAHPQRGTQLDWRHPESRRAVRGTWPLTWSTTRDLSFSIRALS